MKTRITELLNIDYPIFQGGMAWVADGDLAGAVSKAGGLGIIGGGNAPKEVVKANIDKIKSLTDKPFGVNIMLLSPFVEDIVDLVIEEGVKVVTTGAGNPSKYMTRFHDAGITVIPVVPSVALAKRMEKIGADAVIAEGMEAGGHIGKLTTMTLVRQVAAAVSIPVIAAGGIADGEGAAAGFMLGAEAVQVGTRFVVARESNAHPNYKAKILKARDIDTTVSAQHFGHAVRAIKNQLTRDFEQAEKKVAELLADGRNQATELVANAEKRAAQIVEEAKNQASVEAARIAAQAKSDVEQETNRAREALREQVAALAVKGAEAILRSEVNAAKHADLLANLKQEL